MTLSEIESAFAPSGEEVEFSIYEDDIEVARYYNRGIESMSVAGTDPRTVTITFNVTRLSGNVEDEIRASLDDSDGAIEELADLVAMLADIDYDGQVEMLESLASRADNLEQDFDNWRNDLTNQQQSINQLSAAISALTERIDNIEVRHIRR